MANPTPSRVIRTPERAPFRPIRMLIVGDPGGGKTAAIGSLLRHGQKLYAADFDANLEPIYQFIEPQYHENLVAETLLDDLAFDPHLSVAPVGSPKAFRRFVQLVGEWQPSNFGPNEWLVIDTLTTMGSAIFRQITKDHKRFGKEPRVRIRIKEWAVAVERMDTLMDYLKSLRCNLIVTCHLMRLSNPIDDIDDGDDDQPSGSTAAPRTSRKPRMTAQLAETLVKRYPSTLGQKLPLRIAGHFNVALQAKRVGTGAAAKYILRTVPDDDVDLKCPIPSGPQQVDGKDLIQIIHSLRPEWREGAPT